MEAQHLSDCFDIANAPIIPFLAKTAIPQAFCMRLSRDLAALVRSEEDGAMASAAAGAPKRDADC